MLDLPAVLRQETEALMLFANALEGEQQALKRGDSEALPAFNEQKIRTIALLNRLGRQRNGFLRAARLEEDREGLTAWARTSVEARTLVEGFLQLAEKARELNRLNGQLIAMRLRVTQDAMEALALGKAKRGLYDAKGTTSVQTTGYRLIDAV